MIKKIIACFTICFIITGFISPVFSDASALPQPNWTDPGISEIINISDLTGWMLNGGTFDVSTYTDAESFMNDYFNARTQTRLVSPDNVQEDYYEVLPGFGINNQLIAGESFARPLDTNRVIASSFRDHTGYGRRFSNEVNKALLSTGHLYDTKIPLLNEIEFANFVGYNHDALNLYAQQFINSNDPIPEPDPTYAFISNINNIYISDSINFLAYPKTQIQSASHDPVYNIRYNIKDLTFTSPDFISNQSHLSNSTTPNNGLRLWAIYPKATININTNSDDTVSVSYSNTSNVSWTYNDWESNPYSMNLTRYDSSTGDFWGWYYYQQAPYVQAFTQTDFAGLSTALNYIYQHYANINLYVDGQLWISGDAPTQTLTPEFPDAVGGEDFPATTWPISRPRAPYYTNVPGVLQAIEDAIADDGKFDIDDLKPYLTDENGDPVPDPIFDPEPVPIPVPDPVNPDIIPGLPILPAIPPEMPGFNGVSVLAEIINFTNQSLPSALIVTFWGIVFGIVILGLIKILHK